MLDLESLNPPQRNAVESITGPLMILAGAGTGKTRVISVRVCHMILQGICPTSIVALTFTNKAAKEMASRIRELIGKKANGLNVGTFHSFCLKQLRKYPDEANLQEGFSLAGSSDQIDIVRRVLEELGYTKVFRPEELLSRISSAKSHVLAPKNIEELGQIDADAHLLSKIYSLYERHLKLNNAIDFDDCIYKFIQLAKSNQTVKSSLQKQFKYFLVDEFQDTNICQLEALDQVASKSQNVCVVGDDDQSIYSWRGADPSILLKFEKLFPQTKLIKLEQNYRCTSIILDAANEVIRNNQQRKSKTLWSEKKSEDKIFVRSEKDDTGEARWVAQKCQAIIGSGNKGRDIGILYRTNSQARALEVALRESRIKYRVYGGSSFFERKEVKDFLSYFKLVLSESDALSFWRIINTPPRGVGLKSQEIIAEFSKNNECSPLLGAQKVIRQLPNKAQGGITELAEIYQSLKNHPTSTPEEIESLGQKIISSFKLAEDIRAKVSQDASRQRKVDSLKKLPSWLKTICEEYAQEHGKLKPNDIIDSLCLSSDPKPEVESTESNSVSLMTIHSAKGLEFPFVFICGVEEEQIPHKNSQSLREVAEERRLFYVALTRAKRKLFITWSRKRYSGFQLSDRKPSRFLDEIPSSLIDMKKEVLSTQQKKTNSLNKLAALRRSMKSSPN